MQHKEILKSNPFFHKDVKNSSEAKKLISNKKYTPGSYFLYQKSEQEFILVMKLLSDSLESEPFELAITTLSDRDWLILTADTNPHYNKFSSINLQTTEVFSLDYFVTKLGGLAGINYSDKKLEETSDRGFGPIRLALSTLLFDSKREGALSFSNYAGFILMKPNVVTKGLAFTITNNNTNQTINIDTDEKGFFLDEFKVADANQMFLEMSGNTIPEHPRKEPAAASISLDDQGSFTAKKSLLSDKYKPGTYTISAPHGSNSLIIDVLIQPEKVFEFRLTGPNASGLYIYDMTTQGLNSEDEKKIKKLGLTGSYKELMHFISRCGGHQQLRMDGNVVTTANYSNKLIANLALQIISFEYFTEKKGGKKTLDLTTTDGPYSLAAMTIASMETYAITSREETPEDKSIYLPVDRKTGTLFNFMTSAQYVSLQETGSLNARRMFDGIRSLQQFYTLIHGNTPTTAPITTETSAENSNKSKKLKITHSEETNITSNVNLNVPSSQKEEIAKAESILLDQKKMYPAGTYIITNNNNVFTLNVITMTREIFKVEINFSPATNKYTVNYLLFNPKERDVLKHLGLLESSSDLNYFILRSGGFQELSKDGKVIPTGTSDDRTKSALARHIVTYEFFTKGVSNNQSLQMTTKETNLVALTKTNVQELTFYTYSIAEDFNKNNSKTIEFVCHPKSNILIALMGDDLKSTIYNSASSYEKSIYDTTDNSLRELNNYKYPSMVQNVQVQSMTSEQAKKLLLDSNKMYSPGTYIVSSDSNIVTINVITPTREIFSLDLVAQKDTYNPTNINPSDSTMMQLGLLNLGKNLMYYVARCGGNRQLGSSGSIMITDDAEQRLRSVLALHIITLQFFTKTNDDSKILKLKISNGSQVTLTYDKQTQSYEYNFNENNADEITFNSDKNSKILTIMMDRKMFDDFRGSNVSKIFKDLARKETTFLLKLEGIKDAAPMIAVSNNNIHSTVIKEATPSSNMENSLSRESVTNVNQSSTGSSSTMFFANNNPATTNSNSSQSMDWDYTAPREFTLDPNPSSQNSMLTREVEQPKGTGSNVILHTQDLDDNCTEFYNVATSNKECDEEQEEITRPGM